MGIPILSDLLELVDTAIDKIFPDASDRLEIKSKFKLALLEQALEEQKLIFQDVQSARELYKEELKERGVYKWVKSIRALVRPTIAYTSIAFYVYSKITGIELTGMDYSLIGGVFAFYFGLRHLEKRRGVA